MATTIGQAAQAYHDSASRAATAYREAVKVAQWKSAAVSQAAEDNWRAGLERAFADDSRRKGLEGISNSYWQERASTLGGNILAARIQAGRAKYEARFGPILNT